MAATQVSGVQILNGSIMDIDIASNANIAQSKISNLVSDLSAKAPSSHIHAAGSVTFASYGNLSSTNVQSAVQELDDEKQTLLVSGTNIKTVGGTSILGSGDIPVSSGGAPAYTFYSQTNLTIDGNNGNFFLVTSSANLSFTFSNIDVGVEYHFLIKNTSTTTPIAIAIPTTAISALATVYIEIDSAGKNYTQISMLDNGTNKVFYISEPVELI